MTELAHRFAAREAEATPAPVDVNHSVAELTVWADAARAAYDVAVQLCQTSFVPQSFRDKPHEATAAILSGLEVGLSPMAALRSFDSINGTAAARAATLRAIVQSRGHRIWVHESTATRAIVRGVRLGESQVQESVWTMDRARQLGLAGKSNWRSQPQAMLVARATSECCRLIASDAILGIAYSAEELADGADDEPVQSINAPPTKRTRRTAKRQPVPAALPQSPVREPDLVPNPQTDTGVASSAAPPVADEMESNEPAPPIPAPEPDDDPAPVSPDMITEPQMKLMHAAFRDLGIEDRQQRLDFAARVLDMPVETSTALTMRQASDVIDALEHELANLPRGAT